MAAKVGTIWLGKSTPLCSLKRIGLGTDNKVIVAMLSIDYLC
jgi:hypothetical protein